MTETLRTTRSQWVSEALVCLDFGWLTHLDFCSVGSAYIVVFGLYRNVASTGWCFAFQTHLYLCSSRWRVNQNLSSMEQSHRSQTSTPAVMLLFSRAPLKVKVCALGLLLSLLMVYIYLRNHWIYYFERLLAIDANSTIKELDRLLPGVP